MSIYQLLQYSVPLLIDSTSNGYTLITIHELKPWGFFAFNKFLQAVMQPLCTKRKIYLSLKGDILDHVCYESFYGLLPVNWHDSTRSLKTSHIFCAQIILTKVIYNDDIPVIKAHLTVHVLTHNVSYLIKNMKIVLKIIVMGDPCFLQEICDQICTNDLSISKYENNKTIIYTVEPL